MKAQADCQKAAVEFQRAAGVHAAAKVIRNIDSWIIEIEIRRQIMQFEK